LLVVIIDSLLCVGKVLCWLPGVLIARPACPLNKILQFPVIELVREDLLHLPFFLVVHDDWLKIQYRGARAPRVLL
jgi:hypothetical protein